MRGQGAAALFVALLAGCSPVLPSAAPDATAAPWNRLISSRIAITAIVDGLPVQVEPSGTADSVGTFARGDVAVVQSFPVETEGTAWYYVMKVTTPEPGRLPPLPAPVTYEHYALVGWIAASGPAGEHIARTDLRCPTVVDLKNVAAMLGGERLACFGPEPITIDGTFACEECSGGELGTHAPSWLAGHGGGSLSDQSDVDRRGVGLFFPSGVAPPPSGAYVRVTGHHDDSGSRTCVMDPIVMLGDDAGLLPAEAFGQLSVEACRQRFVVDSFEIMSAPNAS